MTIDLISGTICTGGGGADVALRSLGIHTAWGIEYDPKIAAVAQSNDPMGIIHAASCVDIDYAQLPRVDILHASPPCPSFSVAKTNAQESADDLAIAESICRALRDQMPMLFTLENVRGYSKSQSFARIQAQLLDLDYAISVHILNAADYGVPQTRERLYLIAHAGGFMQRARNLPEKQAWQGWYDAIVDLIPSMPDSQFAPWQLRFLPAELRESFMPSSVNADGGAIPRTADAPAFTVVSTAYKNMPKAFIVNGGDSRPSRAFIADGQTNKGESITLRSDTEPSFTLTAGSGDRRPIRAALEGRVVALTPRALARLQSFPDSYLLPETRSLACRIIGNALAVELYAQLVQSQLAH